MIRTLKNGLLLLSLVLLGACNEEEEQFIASAKAQPLLADLDVDRVELDAANTDNPALTIQWETSDYGVKTPVNYLVEVAMDASFSDPREATTTTKNNFTWSMNDLNNDASSVGFPPFQWNTVYIRVKSFIGTNKALESISTPVAVEVYPYFSYPFKDLFLVGAATAPGWNNNNNNPVLFRNAFNTSLFTYTGFFNNDEFKVLLQRGAWAPQYGQESGALKFRPSESEPDPSNIKIPRGSGFYTMTIDLSKATYTFETLKKVDAPLISISVTGDAATGDVAMTALSFDPHIWNIKSTKLSTGSLRFSANGTTPWGGTTEFSGKATPNGAGIPIPVADDYEIWFNDITGEYAMIPINLSK